MNPVTIWLPNAFGDDSRESFRLNPTVLAWLDTSKQILDTCKHLYLGLPFPSLCSWHAHSSSCSIILLEIACPFLPSSWIWVSMLSVVPEPHSSACPLISNCISPPCMIWSCLMIGTCSGCPLILTPLTYCLEGELIEDMINCFLCVPGKLMVILSKNGLVTWLAQLKRKMKENHIRSNDIFCWYGIYRIESKGTE